MKLVDWAQAFSIVGDVGSLLAAMGVVFAARSIGVQREMIRFQVGMESLRHLNDQFEASWMRSRRALAARFLLWHRENTERRDSTGETEAERGKAALYDVLNHLTMVAYMRFHPHETFSAHDVWYTFGTWILAYGHAAKDTDVMQASPNSVVPYESLRKLYAEVARYDRDVQGEWRGLPSRLPHTRNLGWLASQSPLGWHRSVQVGSGTQGLPAEAAAVALEESIDDFLRGEVELTSDSLPRETGLDG